MTKQRHCFVTDVGDAIEKLADALDPESGKPFRGDILDLLEWAEKDVKAMRQQLASSDAEIAKIKSELRAISAALDDPRTDLTMTMVEVITELRQKLAKVTMERDEAISAVQRLTEGVSFDVIVIADTVKKRTALIEKENDQLRQQLDAKDPFVPDAFDGNDICDAWAGLPVEFFNPGPNFGCLK